jgi:heterodisulfide reductase subunit D
VFTKADQLMAIRSCRSCPMCHHADLVTTLERRETYSARARGLTLFAVEQGVSELGAETADVMYRFFVDGLCRQVCAGHIPHDDMVVDARRRLAAAGHAPSAVAQIKANIAGTGNPWGETEPVLQTLGREKSPQRVLLYFGPTARIKRIGVIQALNRIMEKIRVDFSVLNDERDPGLLLHQLGDWESGAAGAAALAEKIARSGADTLITPDAEAYQTLKVGFGETPALAGPAVLHVSEFLQKCIGQLQFKSPKQRQIAYHDPCALARTVTCLDPPRAIVRAINGASPLEIGPWSRELANCSGECGGVRFTIPRLATHAAERRVQEAKATGAELIVAGSPGAAEMLGGHGLEVLELSEFVAQAL